MRLQPRLCYGVSHTMRWTLTADKANNSQVSISPLHAVLSMCSGAWKFICSAPTAHVGVLLTIYRRRGLRKSAPRQCLSGIVILMLAASTAYVNLVLKFYIMQTPSVMNREPPPGLLHRLMKYEVALSWLSRLNVSAFMRLQQTTLECHSHVLNT